MPNGKTFTIVKNYLRGNLKCCEFAITNACIAKCSFCAIWKQQPKVFVDRDKALAAIDRLADFGVGHLTITGGEPLLHPNVIDFVERATKRRMNNAVLDAAPRLILRNNMLSRLEQAGCDMLSISFDSGDPKTMAEQRQIPNIMEEMARAMEQIKKTRVKTMASVLIWNDNYDKLEEVCQRAVNMGFDLISMNYPTFSHSAVYPLGGDGISLSRDKVIAGLKEACRLRKKYPIANSPTSMKNIIQYLEDPNTVRYKCFGGLRVLFLDWFFEVHPCMQLADNLGNILTMRESDLRPPKNTRTRCNECNMSWYRDFSAYYYGLKSIPVFMDGLFGPKILGT